MRRLLLDILRSDRGQAKPNPLLAFLVIITMAAVLLILLPHTASRRLFLLMMGGASVLGTAFFAIVSGDFRSEKQRAAITQGTERRPSGAFSGEVSSQPSDSASQPRLARQRAQSLVRRSQSPLLIATVDRTGAVLADRVTLARGAGSMRGLLGRDGLPPGEGLYFPDALFGALHSIGMRFAFDALYLDRHGRVRRVLHAVPPGRLCPWDGRTRAALELPAGTLAAAGVRVGDVVRLQGRDDVPPPGRLRGGPPPAFV